MPSGTTELYLNGPLPLIRTPSGIPSSSPLSREARKSLAYKKEKKKKAFIRLGAAILDMARNLSRTRH
ncbi:hypothetical protein HanRHA438_Chr13g0586071 [Helianthus annuus]|nr:hypothetical protein HanRHA438_Chr13g0586071 [Helianthus annuus]